jgi:hypothetical protein
VCRQGRLDALLDALLDGSQDSSWQGLAVQLHRLLLLLVQHLHQEVSRAAGLRGIQQLLQGCSGGDRYENRPCGANRGQIQLHIQPIPTHMR